MRSDKPIHLPPEYRFDVVQAIKSLTTLAETEPEATIAVTLAALSADGLEAESDIYLTAASAAALLATLTEDQRLTAAGRDLVALRVTRTKNPAPRDTDEAWREDQTR